MSPTAVPATGGSRRHSACKRQVEAGDTARADVDRQRQPRALDRRPGRAIDHDHIDQGMIYLDQRERPVGLQRSDYRDVSVARRLTTFPLGDHLPTRTRPKPCGDALAAGRRQTTRRTLTPHFYDQIDDLRSLARQIDSVDRLTDQIFHLLTELGVTKLPTALARQQTSQPRISDVAAHERVNVRWPATQRRCAGLDIGPCPRRIFRQPTDHRQTSTGFVPSGCINHREFGRAHGAVTRVLAAIGIVKSTTSAPRAISRQTTARPASRDTGSASTKWPKQVA